MMTREKTQAVVNALVKLRELASDEQAIEVPVLYPEWKVGVNYIVNERILYNSILYKVLAAHTSQETWTPDAAPSLFAKVLIPDDNEIYPWEQPESTNPYKIGDKVIHNDKIWVSIVDNNTWEPGVYGWEEVKEETEEPEAEVINPWEQRDGSNPYMKGDKVVYNDKIWISIADNNSWSPSVYGWEEYTE